ncbi:phosphoribosyltransferase domain-containing protein [Endozoicomonas ascidiicola]|uniref:phosphoribosyltransferase domain-containing protein n=1 Tax=Endozoicomonas ascidiicola TaxID=1698521 RepID=UPI00082F41DB|nr:phosphoribosyltransferase domain-containing protein [Endozoicomonas ascidiicola]USN27010.1 phosphoribosyltransferase domain-containing protein [synthetic construct]
MEVNISAGTLTLQIYKGEDRLHELLGFASRENQKRGYLFVSKVLGKHIPVKPSTMRCLYQELSKLCGSGQDTFVVGMAETATGLGAGVADSLSLLKNQGSVIYQHTTRHELDSDIWLTIDESHSHAVDHILYQPLDELHDNILSAKRLILVDDEISTGRTLFLLAEKLLAELKNVEELIIVSIVSWLDADKKQLFETLPVCTRFVNLIEGEFTYTPDDAFSPTLPDNIDKGICKDPSRDDLGRRGIKLPYQDALVTPEQHKSGKWTVVGTGEHLFLPFLIAEQMEASGADVLFQSTTRSPILPGDAIQHKVTFSDTGKDVVNFIYNLPADRKVHLICEDEGAYDSNGFARYLKQGKNNV